MEASFLLTAIEWLEMDPHGVITGAVGAMLSLFVLNGNAFSWRRTFFILFAGVAISGYSMPWIEAKVVDEGDTRALAHLLNILVGFTASDLMSSIKSAAPTATNFLVQKFMDFGKRFFPDKKSNDG